MEDHDRQSEDPGRLSGSYTSLEPLERLSKVLNRLSEASDRLFRATDRL